MTNWQKNMAELGDYWMENCDEQSKREGWALFNHDGILQIQALDDPEEGQATLKGGDGEAYAICTEKAIRGSALHLLALYLDGRPAGNVDVPLMLLRKCPDCGVKLEEDSDDGDVCQTCFDNFNGLTIDEIMA